MPKYTPYILVNLEAMPLFHFCAHLFSMPPYALLFCPSNDSVPACATVHCRLFQASRTLQLHPVSKVSHPPSAVQWTLKPVTVAVQYLSDWLSTCTGAKQTQTACVGAMDNFSITPEVCNERDVSSRVHSRSTSPLQSVHKVVSLNCVRWPVALFTLIKRI